METWKTILLAFGGNAALLAVLGLLFKSLIEKILALDSTRYELELKELARGTLVSYVTY